MTRKHRWLKIVLPLLLLAMGAAVMIGLIKMRPAPKKRPVNNPGALVRIVEVEKTSHQVTVSGTGTVQAAQEASITPQVSGRVVAMAPEMVAGGFFRQGELMFAIEDADFRLLVEQAAAALKRAELELETARAQARIARQEWERLKRPDEEPNPLVLYEPQLKAAEADLASARAALDKARLDLQRTEIHAPFNCYVRNEQLDLGQYLKSGTSVATVAGTDAAEIVVPLALEDLFWLAVPEQHAATEGAEATAMINTEQEDFSWSGRVVRSLNEVDERGRMRRLVVRIEDPYGLDGTTKKERRPDLAMGTFVQVLLHGRFLTDVAVLPRSALREGDTLWLVDDENKLRIRSVEVLRREKQMVLLNGSLRDGDRVVLTNLAGAAEGMQLRLMLEEDQP